MVGTSNSDSHEPQVEEPGSPRNYVRVASDVPAAVDGQQIVDAFAAGDILMTNGPFLRVVASSGKGPPSGMGSTIAVEESAVHLEVSLRAAPWVVTDTLIVYVDGVERERRTVPRASSSQFSTAFDLDIESDGFVVVEAVGAGNLFPSLVPNEVPPLQFSDVINTIGVELALGTPPNALQPAKVNATKPYALTNPIWLDGDGDGLVAPSRKLVRDASVQAPHARRTHRAPAAEAPLAWVATEQETHLSRELARAAALPVRQRQLLSRFPMWLWPQEDPRDVRKLLLQFAGHGH